MSSSIHLAQTANRDSSTIEAHQHQDSAARGSAAVSVSFFALSVFSFACGVFALPFIVPRAAEFFYQAIPLAITHIFTLGWITAAIMGVMYRYVPALTRTPLRSRQLAWIQLALYVVGVSGMIVHFAIGIWPGLWLAAMVVVVSILMFAWNILPCLTAQFGSGVAETGMFLSICFLIAAALLGTLLGLDKSYDFLGGSVLTNLAAHLHLAAVGWVTVSICAVSYRMLPAFLLPTVTLPASAKWQLYALAAAVAALAIALLFRSPAAPIFAIAIALTMVWYVAILARMVRTRRMPLNWTPMHAMAGVVSLAAALALGIALSFVGGDTNLGARLAPAYGVMGLLGFFSNFIIGMSYQLFPGIVARARTEAGFPPVTIAEISVAKPRLLIFSTFNGGVVALAIGFIVGTIELSLIGSLLVAFGGLLYAATTMWTLSYAVRRSIPRAAQSPLRVLPS
jgi:hypothetical protein